MKGCFFSLSLLTMVSIDYCIHKSLILKTPDCVTILVMGLNLAIPGSNGQTKKTLLKIFLDASFSYYKTHITLLFCSLNWNRQAFMASQTLRLFGFVVHPARVFMHTGVLTILPNQTVPANTSGIIMGKWLKGPPLDLDHFCRNFSRGPKSFFYFSTEILA